MSDPIFASIGAHRAATALADAVIRESEFLETSLPNDKRRSICSVWGEEIVATDDQRWIDIQRAIMRAWDGQDDAALALLNVRPTTLAGVTALLRYAVEANVDDQTWAVELMDDGNPRSWHHLLVNNVAVAIQNCA